MGAFAGLILAGGEGERWGGPKMSANLPDGRSFLESCVDILSKAGARPIVATLPPQAEMPVPKGLAAVRLTEKGLDMFASLKAGLRSLVEYPSWSGVAILPVDHPLVSSQTVTRLFRQKARAAIPSFRGKHGHPVCVTRSVAEAIVEGNLTGPTLREVLRSVDASRVPVNDPGVVSNCNTPEALARALEAIRYHSTGS